MKNVHRLPSGYQPTGSLKVATAILMSVLISACAVSEDRRQTFADYDPGVSFTGFHSFAWQSADPILIATPRPLAPKTREALMAETVDQLEAKGFTRVDTAANADLLVAIVIGTRDDAHINSYSGRYGGSYSEVRESTTAGLGIELFDRRSEQRLWTGWATTGLTMDVYANGENVIRELVEMIMEQFPPPSPPPAA